MLGKLSLEAIPYHEPIIMGAVGAMIMGGLLVSTVVTLIVVPVLYAIMSRHGERDKDKKNRETFIFMQLSDKDKDAK